MKAVLDSAVVIVLLAFLHLGVAVAVAALPLNCSFVLAR